MLFPYDAKIAQQAEENLHKGNPQNRWSPGYISLIIRHCCNGVADFRNHHGAFGEYLRLHDKAFGYCLNCGETVIEPLFSNDYPSQDERPFFCDDYCERDYHDG